MDRPCDRRAFLKTTAGTLSLLASSEGLGAAQTPPSAAFRRQKHVRFGERQREIVS